MRRCCFLSMDSLDGYVSDDELAIEPLRDLGWQVDTVSWRDVDADWNSFDSVVIRTTWDYQDSPSEFLDVRRRIDRSNARLDNPLSIIEWNLDKTYLRELESRGFKIVPTLWGEKRASQRSFEDWTSELRSDELIIKPTVSATAQDTFRLSAFDPALSEIFGSRSYMVQPFIPAVVDEGEYSLFFFNGVYSHAILKTPKTGDFRVQEEHGGIITSIEPEASLMSAATSIAKSIEPEPLYTRIDLVRFCDEWLLDEWLLMELELIEPALYFRMSSTAAELFATQLDRRMNEL
ncbi:MAG: hypothetical protein QUS14_07995 [Pyrinomonadaceae bacterium]|nr:hypothetical protein [Pyrinomonadaceae bacterium]